MKKLFKRNLLLLCKIFCSKKFYRLTLINHIIKKIKELEKLDEITIHRNNKAICINLLECLTRLELIIIELEVYKFIGNNLDLVSGDISESILPEMWELGRKKMLTDSVFWWDAYESKERIEFLQELKIVIKNKKQIYPWWATS